MNWAWPVTAALRSTADALDIWSGDHLQALAARPCDDFVWLTANDVVLELDTLRLRRFRGGAGEPILIVTPLALHGAGLADLAPSHSLVECFLKESASPLYLLEWRSASHAMCFLSIDDYLAHLAIVVDDLGGRAALVGLCQGGWLSLIFAARFPAKASALVLAGAPIDLDAAPSDAAWGARALSPAVFEGAVRAWNGVIPSSMILPFATPAQDDHAICDILQSGEVGPEVIERFRHWHRSTLDLPGAYYLDVVNELFRENRLARSELRALGHLAKLDAVRIPLFLLAGDRDGLVPAAQVLAVQALVGSDRGTIRSRIVAADHLSLFIGRAVLTDAWVEVAHWLDSLSEARAA